MTREDAARFGSPQPWPLSEVDPAEPTLRVVRIGDVSTLPCDAPHVESTREIGRFVLPEAERRGEATRLLARVLPPAP
jgi:Ser-tRNA(Ala) deacylase AlaX